jgi:drug/metabolite transporter (DMT)-like permease
MASKTSSARGYAFIALTTVLFSTMEIALKTVAGRFNPLQLNFLRFMIGGLFLLPFALRSLKKRGTTLEARDFGFFALSGLACVVASMSLYQLAIQYCKASIVAILFSCNPVFVLPLAAIFLKERIRGFNIATLIASLAGMLCIVNPFNAGAEVSLIGLVLSVVSAIVFAIYGVMGRTKSGRIGGLATTAFSFLFGSLELVIIIFLSRLPAISNWLDATGLGEFARIPFFKGLDFGVLPIFAYISLCVTGVGFAAYFMAIEETSASTAAIVFYIKPALAPILALLILGESIAPSTIAGIVLIVVGSAISVIGPRRTRNRS